MTTTTLAERLRDDIAQLERMIEQASFAGAETGVRVKRPDLLLADLREAAAHLDHTAAQVTGEPDWKRAFAAQSRKLQAVLHIPGVRETLADLDPAPAGEAPAMPVAQWHPGVMRALSEKPTQTSDTKGLSAVLREWAGNYEEGSFDTEAGLMSEAAAALDKAEAAIKEHLRGKNDLVLAAYPAMDAIDAIRKWCDEQQYENDTITVAKLRAMLPPLVAAISSYEAEAGLPSPCSMTLADAVVHAAYNSDEDARLVFDMLGGSSPPEQEPPSRTDSR